MPRWEGIMDESSSSSSSSSLPEPIWLSGTTSTTRIGGGTTDTTSTGSTTSTVNTTSNTTTTASTTTTNVVPPNNSNHNNNNMWKPLRKCDCHLLNQRYTEYMTDMTTTTNNNNNNHHLVYIDGGRKVVNMNDMTMSPTYGRNHSHNNDRNPIEESVVVTRATWFVRYDYHHSTHGKYVTMTTTTTSNSNNNNNKSSSSQPQMEYKEDGTTVQSSYILYPITNMTDVQNIETFYQEIATTWNNSASSSSTSNTVKSKLLEKTILIDQGTYKVQIQYSINNNKNDIVSLRKVPNETGWISNMVQFKPSYTLQRGYSPYQIPGEEIELALGPVRHLVFVIHGIGEALFHRTDIQITGMIQQTNQLRHIIQNKQYTQWQIQCQNINTTNKKKNRITSNAVLELPPPPNRIEVIPIEWYHCLHGSPSSNNTNNNSNSNNNTSSTTEDLIRNLQLVTLNTIPALRTIANDVLLDVLLYCTPTFGGIVLQTVTQQIQQYYRIFTENVFPDFLEQGGKVSMVGHSLGSVIVWDLLATAKQQKEQKQEEEETLSLNIHSNNGNDTDTIRPSTTASYGPTVFPPMTDVIPFVPEYSILLGSPMGMFLSLRNATQLFQLETTTTTTLLSNSIQCSVSSFTLPTNHLYNIFHPSDPVAYRIEPLLLFESPSNLDSSSSSSSSVASLYSNLPEPVYLTVPGEDVRLHVKAIQFTNVVRKSLFSSSSTGNHSKSNLDRGTFRTSSHHSGGGDGGTTSSSSSSTVINSWTSLLESAIANVSSTQQQTNNDKNGNNNSGTDTKVPSTTLPSGSKHDSTTTNHIRFPLGGPKNPRIDYCLQPLIVDNEYISAVTAHSSYFSNTDVQDFLIGILK